MATFAFIHGAGDVGWYWHLVAQELRADGHVAVAPDLPIGDDNAGLAEYADVVESAVADAGPADDLVVVAQSFGGYVAPIVAGRLGARLIVLVAGMVPRPDESAEAMLGRTGWRPLPGPWRSAREVFYHDVPAELADEALRRGGRPQSDTPGREPWPLERWPAIPVRFVLCRFDRFFPAPWLRGVVRDRLGIEPDEIESGHCPALSRPKALAALLERFAGEVLDRSPAEDQSDRNVHPARGPRPADRKIDPWSVP